MKVCPVCSAEYGDDAAFCSRDRSPLRPSGSGLIGQLLGERYQIEKKLGEGGMGEVYLARHVLMGRSCAIKVVSPSLSRDPDAVGRFNREATNASRISHPNVCAVYDFGLTGEGLIYLAMEFIEGRTLTDMLKESPPFELSRAASIVSQCAAGLQAAHDLGIVHRDLKPDNVMLVDQRGRETVKLVDFGIAKAAGAEGDQRVTRTGLVVGTPEFMSPEQLSGDPLDGRSDEYALALVLFRMLTGRLPFSSGSAHETMAKRLTERPRRLSDALPERRFPDALQQVVDRALERKPENRFPSVTAFAEAVDAVLRAAAEESEATQIVSPPERISAALPKTQVTSPSGPRRAILLAGGALVVLSGIAIALSQLGGGAAKPSERQIPPRSESTTLGSVPPPPPPPAAPPSPARDSPPGASRGDTSRSGVAAQQGGKPDSATQPAGTPGEVGPSLATAPTLDDFEQPMSERARSAARRAKLLWEARARLPDSVRAEMGYYLGQWHLDQNDRNAASRYFRRACTLSWRPRCGRLLEQFRNVP